MFKRHLNFGVIAGALLAVAASSASAVPTLRVLPVGDSITYGSSVNGGYRMPLYEMLTNAGFNVDMIGTQTGNSTGMAEPNHEGHGGWRIDQIDGIILGVLDQIVDPDVILVLIGTNDFGQSYDYTNAIYRLDALIAKMATNRPYAKIVVANLTERGEPYNARIQALFNPFVQGVVSNHAALGRQVYFTDLRSAVPVADMPDALHPGALGYTKMATNWFGAITNQFSPGGSTNAPALARVRSTGRTGLRITFSKPVNSASATNLANYALNGGAGISNAIFDATTERDVVLVTSTQAAATVYTLTVNHVTDQTAAATPVANDSQAQFEAGPDRGVFNNVPEASEFSLVYSLDISNSVNYTSAATYTLDLHSYVSNFARVAYYLELQTASGPLQYVWVSMNPFTNAASALGVPTVSSGEFFQQPVTNMNVKSSVTSLVTGTNLSGGNIEFWPWNYTASNIVPVVNASSSLYDWGDMASTNSGNYGSMQIHNAAARQTILAFNRWGGTAGTGYADLGIGNGGSNPDWTFASNANTYVVKTLQVFALPADNMGAPVLIRGAGQLGATNVVLDFSEPLDDDATNTAHYAFTGGLTVLAAAVDPVTKTHVTLTTSTQTMATAYTVTVNGVRDRTANHTPIATDSQATFMTAAGRGVFGNIAEAAEYSLVYSLDIVDAPDYSSTLVYNRNNAARTPAFDRVAYYLELQKSGENVQFVWVSMDAFTNAASAIGVPTTASGAAFQQPVTNMNVRSTVTSLAGTNLSGGNIEFWPDTYTASNGPPVANASSTLYDWGDYRSVGGSYGSMQVHNHDASQVLFAFNSWNKAGAGDLGIGNGTGANPDWTTMQNTASYTVKTLQVFVHPMTNVPPVVTSCVVQPGSTSVVVTISKPLSDDATNIAHYALSGGLAVQSVLLDATDKLSLTLITSAQAPGTRYTVSFSGLRDRTAEGLAMAAGTTAQFVTTALPGRGALHNVPGAAGYTLVYSIELPNAAAYNTTGVTYGVDNHNGVGAFSRVAYYLELVQAGVSTNFVWAEMDPFTQDASRIGIPAMSAGAVFQRPVSNLTVYSSAAGVAVGDFAAGNLEFWPFDYATTNASNVVNASAANFDWGDSVSLGTGGYGCMQVHNAEQRQTVLAVNNFGGAGGSNLCVGIGNYSVAANADWTHIKNAADYAVKTLQVYVLQPPDTGAPTVVSAALALDREHIVVRFGEPVADAAANAANFALSGGLTVLGAVLGTDPREVILTISPAAAGAAYTVTVNGVRDRSPNANRIAADTVAAVTAAAPPARIVANVPEAAAYRLACQLALPAYNANLNYTGTVYDVDNRAAVGAFSRVAYYLELAGTAGTTHWVYASMDAFTTDPGKIGIPDRPSGAVFQQFVTNLNVYSGDPTLVTGTNIATGNIEFWPYNYTGANAKSVPGAGVALDCGDTTDPNTFGYLAYGSMQVHNYAVGGTGQVVFAYNGWGKTNAYADLGIGNRAGNTNFDWYGAVNAGTQLVRNLYVLVLPAADAVAPTIAQALPSINRTNLLVRFSEPVSGASAAPTNFALSGGVAVTAAALRTNLREVLLTTGAQTPGAAYTLTVNNVRDRSTNGNVIAVNSTTNFTAPADLPVFSRVLEAADYRLACQLAIPTVAPNYNTAGITYTLDQRALLDQPFDRIAYYFELAATAGGTTNWVYESSEAFTPLIGRVGIPALGTGAGFQQKLTNMNVRSSDATIVTGDAIATGNIESWPFNYTGTTNALIPTGLAGSTVYDWNDSVTVASGSQHACLQLHNYAANSTGQVLFAFNKWGAGQSGNTSVGIGTQSNSVNMDWTFNYNAGSYAVKNLSVLVRPAAAPAPIVALPALVAQPQDRLDQLGGGVTLAGTALGGAPLSYQWRRDGQPLDGRTNAWLELSGLGSGDAAGYDLIVVNSAGSTTSVVATLEINRPPLASRASAGTRMNQPASFALGKLLAYASDPDGDAVTVAGAGPASTNGGSVVLGADAVVYTPPAGYAGADLYTVLFSDGRGGSATGEVAVTVASGQATSLNSVGGPTIDGGAVILLFAGVPGYSYTLEATASLLAPDWQPVTNMVAPLTNLGQGIGIIRFVDPDGVASQRYYRTVSP